MQKRKKGRKFGRETDQRKALLRSLSNALLEREKITTTEAKAKGLSVYVSKLITKAKNKKLASTKELSKLFSEKIVKKLINEIAPRYSGRKGGYTRISKLGPRKSDRSHMAIIELVK